jgi:hypothetical protein
MTDIEHPIVAALHIVANVTQPYPCDLLEATRARFVAQIAERQPVAPWTAELLGCDDVDVWTPPVSEQDDERNSRPSQY